MNKEIKELMCPMKFQANLANPFCHKQLCAWWSEYHEACAIHTLNEIPQQLFQLTRE